MRYRVPGCDADPRCSGLEAVFASTRGSRRKDEL